MRDIHCTINWRGAKKTPTKTPRSAARKRIPQAPDQKESKVRNPTAQDQKSKSFPLRSTQNRPAQEKENEKTQAGRS